MPVKIADIKTQKHAGTAIANAFKLLISKVKEKQKKQKADSKKGRGRLLNK